MSPSNTTTIANIINPAIALSDPRLMKRDTAVSAILDTDIIDHKKAAKTLLQSGIKTGIKCKNPATFMYSTSWMMKPKKETTTTKSPKPIPLCHLLLEMDLF
eukprot:snap_masked-scaffold_10-processed-gene-9.19-mRNA-1 protein AED:1.00 eAED:1.00 QI:0/0/0/0/1/1/2/0/101